MKTVSTKGYVWLSGGVMLVLILLSGIFWQERAWFLDVAYQTVLMIKDGTVQVQVYRFGAAVVQALPLLAIKLGLPLVWVSALYSLSFTLIYLLFFVVIVVVLRQWKLGVALAILYTAMVYDGFYWCTSELQQGLGFLLVVWAFILRFPQLNKPGHWLFLVPAVIALVFYHPLVFIPFFFCWVYLGWVNRELRHLPYLGLLGWMLLVLWGKSHWFGNWYDTAKMETFRTNLANFYPNYLDLPAYGKFLENALLYWWGFLLLLLIVVVWQLSRKKWLDVLMVLGATLLFLVLNAIGSPDPAYRFYSEVNYYPLIFFVAIPFCYTILPKWYTYRWCLPALALFFGIRLLIIGLHHQPYSERLNWMEQTITTAQDDFQTDRFIRAEHTVPLDTLIMAWGTPFESLLISAATSPEKATTYFITPDPARFPDSLQQRSDVFLMEFFNIPLDEINGPYFELDVQQTYQLVE